MIDGKVLADSVSSCCTIIDVNGESYCLAQACEVRVAIREDLSGVGQRTPLERLSCEVENWKRRIVRIFKSK